MVLLKNGHILLLKEKDPPALIEFGPEDDEPSGYKPGDASTTTAFPLPDEEETKFVDLAVWRIGDKSAPLAGDLSDVAVGPKGVLYVLSDEGRLIAQLESTLRTEEEAFRFKSVWKLPKVIDKPEGLTFRPDGRALVAIDSTSTKDNLFVLGAMH